MKLSRFSAAQMLCGFFASLLNGCSPTSPIGVNAILKDPTDAQSLYEAASRIVQQDAGPAGLNQDPASTLGIVQMEKIIASSCAKLPEYNALKSDFASQRPIVYRTALGSFLTETVPGNPAIQHSVAVRVSDHACGVLIRGTGEVLPQLSGHWASSAVLLALDAVGFPVFDDPPSDTKVARGRALGVLGVYAMLQDPSYATDAVPPLAENTTSIVTNQQTPPRLPRPKDLPLVIALKRAGFRTLDELQSSSVAVKCHPYWGAATSCDVTHPPAPCLGTIECSALTFVFEGQRLSGARMTISAQQWSEEMDLVHALPDHESGVKSIALLGPCFLRTTTTISGEEGSEAFEATSCSTDDATNFAADKAIIVHIASAGRSVEPSDADVRPRGNGATSG